MGLQDTRGMVVVMSETGHKMLKYTPITELQYRACQLGIIVEKSVLFSVQVCAVIFYLFIIVLKMNTSLLKINSSLMMWHRFYLLRSLPRPIKKQNKNVPCEAL